MILTITLLAASSCYLLAENSFLDSLEGKIEEKEENSELYDKFFEEKEEDLEAKKRAEEARKLELRNTPSQFPERKNAVVQFYKNETNRYVQEASAEASLNFRAITGEGTDAGLNLTLGTTARVFNSADLEARIMLDHGGYQGIERLRLTYDVSETMIPIHSTMQNGFLGVYNNVLSKPFSLLTPVFGEIFPEASLNEIESAELRIGKYRPRFGSQYATDPSLRLTPFLPQIVEQIAPHNALGMEYLVQNDYWNWTYGLFSSDSSRNIPRIDDGVMFHVGLGYNFGKVDTKRDETIQIFRELRADYYYNSEADESSRTSLEQLAAISFLSQTDNFTFNLDGFLGRGDGLTTWGLNLTGAYWLKHDFLQLVALYQHSNASEDDSLAVNRGVPGARAETSFPSNFDPESVSFGNLYHSLYLGANTYFFHDRLRISAGIEYRTLETSNGEDEELWMGQAQAIYSF